MSYTRETPRDLFNESKLLKCLGQLSLIIHNTVDSDGNAELQKRKPFVHGDSYGAVVAGYIENDDGNDGGKGPPEQVHPLRKRRTDDCWQFVEDIDDDQDAGDDDTYE